MKTHKRFKSIGIAIIIGMMFLAVFDTKVNIDTINAAYDPLASQIDGAMVTSWNNGPVTYVNGVVKTETKRLFGNATVSSGSVTFNLTKENTSNGTAICTNVYKESANFWIDDAVTQYQFGSYSVSENKKTMSVTVNRIATTSSNGLINLIGGVVQFLTGIVFSPASNGVVVHYSITCD